ncbi:MAG: ABC transporter substrate-binding protein [Coriobacteriia bacterium]|nr:ABC transporter substrate-binding protein [Coriobacteriia bacterium]
MHHRFRTTVRTFALVLALALIAALAFAGLPGCTRAEETAEETPAEAAFPVVITDDTGREVTIAERPERIVSLAPANTEIVAALGGLDRLVGVTTYCDYPEEVAEIEKVGDFVGPNLEAIAALGPDLVLVTTGVQADVIEQLEALGAAVVAIDPQTLDDLYVSIGTVGDAIGEPEAASELVESMELQIDTISERVETAPVTCFLEIAQDPLFTVGSGTLLNDLIEHAGGENVVTEEGYVAYSVEQLVAADPEVYLATLGSMSSPTDITGRPGYENLAAVMNDRVYLLDDNLVSRPGPRVVEGVRLLAEALHPDAFAE